MALAETLNSFQNIMISYYLLNIRLDPTTLGYKHAVVDVVTGISVRHTQRQNGPPSKRLFHNSLNIREMFRVIKLRQSANTNYTIKLFLYLLHDGGIV